jgi:TolB-like protein
VDEKVSAIAKEKIVSTETSIAVLSFNDLTGVPKNEYFAQGFSYELLVELSKYEDLQVFNYLSANDHPENGSVLHSSLVEKRIRFTIGGVVHRDKEKIMFW